MDDDMRDWGLEEMTLEVRDQSTRLHRGTSARKTVLLGAAGLFLGIVAGFSAWAIIVQHPVPTLPRNLQSDATKDLEIAKLKAALRVAEDRTSRLQSEIDDVRSAAAKGSASRAPMPTLLDHFLDSLQDADG